MSGSELSEEDLVSLGLCASDLPDVAGIGMLDDWAYQELYIKEHTVNYIQPLASGDKGYVVSNLRTFRIRVELFDCRVQSLSSLPLRLKAEVVYENSQPIRDDGEPALIGSTEVDVQDGMATFTLRMGKHTLSNKHDGQRFRIKISPANPALAAAHPRLTYLNDPLKSLTKLPSARTSRGGGANAGATANAARAANCAGAANVASPAPPPAPPRLPDYGAAGLGSAREPAARRQSDRGANALAVAGESTGVARNGLPGGLGGLPGGLGGLPGGLGGLPGGLGGLPAGVSSIPSALGAPSLNEVHTSSGYIRSGLLGEASASGEGGPQSTAAQLQRDLAASERDKQALAASVRSQRDAIEMLGRQNALIMKEIARLKESGGPPSRARKVAASGQARGQPAAPPHAEASATGAEAAASGAEDELERINPLDFLCDPNDLTDPNGNGEC